MTLGINHDVTLKGKFTDGNDSAVVDSDITDRIKSCLWVDNPSTAYYDIIGESVSGRGQKNGYESCEKSHAGQTSIQSPMPIALGAVKAVNTAPVQTFVIPLLSTHMQC
jgi:hypothetical protein